MEHGDTPAILKYFHCSLQSHLASTGCLRQHFFPFIIQQSPIDAIQSDTGLLTWWFRHQKTQGWHCKAWIILLWHTAVTYVCVQPLTDITDYTTMLTSAWWHQPRTEPLKQHFSTSPCREPLGADNIADMRFVLFEVKLLQLKWNTEHFHVLLIY